MNNKLLQFREQLYRQLDLSNRANVILDTIDALSCAEGAHSPAEVTLHPAFRGRHLYDSKDKKDLQHSSHDHAYASYSDCEQG